MTSSYVLAGIPGAGGDDYTAGLERLEQLLAHPPWHARAACRGYGTEAFFAVDPEAAQQTCASCPVRPECAEAGQTEPAGVWGGLSVRQRRRSEES